MGKRKKKKKNNARKSTRVDVAGKIATPPPSPLSPEPDDVAEYSVQDASVPGPSSMSAASVPKGSASESADTVLTRGPSSSIELVNDLITGYDSRATTYELFLGYAHIML